MNSSGIVYEDGAFVTDLLFENPYYATGYPITEAYWSNVMLAGSSQWVLTQAFERRVLTYAPNNNEGFQVEAGNVGLHYYEWRYETDITGAADVTTFDNDGTTVQGGVLVEAYALAEDGACEDVTFGTDEPDATGTTDATTGIYSFADLEAGVYCFGADFDGDDVANDAKAVATVPEAGSVAVDLDDPNAAATLTVTILDDEDGAIADATVELFAGICAELDTDDTAVATGTTLASGEVVLDVADLGNGEYCLVATDNGTVIGQTDVALPDDTDVTIGGDAGISVESSVGANEVQTIEATGATDGTFTLTFEGETTDAISYDATADAIEDELEELPSFDPGDLEVSGGPVDDADVLIEFTGDYEFTNVSEITADGAGLDGGTISVETTAEGDAGVNEVQTLGETTATAGTFTLSFEGDTTGALDFDADAGDIQTALEGLDGIGSGNVDVGGTAIDEGDVTITFTGELAAQDVSTISSNDGNLTGGSVGVSTPTPGEASVNEEQTLAATGVTSGTFTLTYDGETTEAIQYDATGAVIEDELEELSNLDPGDVEVTGGPINTDDVVVEFTGDLAAMDVDAITVNGDDLVGTTVDVTTTTQGSSPVIQVLDVGAVVSGGTFTLTYEGETTTAIDHDATAAEVEDALEDLSTIENVSVTGDLTPGESTTITFIDPSPPTSVIVVDDALIT